MPDPQKGSTTGTAIQYPLYSVQDAKQQQPRVIILAGDFCFAAFVREGCRGTAGRVAISFHGITPFYCVFPIRRGGRDKFTSVFCSCKGHSYIYLYSSLYPSAYLDDKQPLTACIMRADCTVNV